jgi:hypothetical protein
MVAGACTPMFHDDPALITEARVLAVQFDPPEAAAGGDVIARALVASPSGTLTDAAVDWSWCLVPKPPADNGIVNVECLAGGEVVGSGTQTRLSIPPDACSLFGSETPPGDYRPRDPDATGGFYQPVRLDVDGASSFGLERITCRQRSLSVDVATELSRTYVANRNPRLLPVESTGTNGTEGGTAASVVVGDDVRVTLRVDGADFEAFPIVDLQTQTLLTARETLRFGLFGSGGRFASSRFDGIDADDGPEVSTTWRAPQEVGTVHLWAVVTDSRGGSDFVGWDVVVVTR